MSMEKRAHKRFSGKEGAFAAFLRPNELVNLGNIVDISIGGLGVRYLCSSETGCECTRIKIFGSNGAFIHIEGIECKIVYDEEIPNSSWSQLRTRRCGVRFKELNVRQMSKLQEFIEHFTYQES